jgi:serine protease inhibitor
MRWAYRVNLALIICAGAAAVLWLRPADAVQPLPAVDKGFVTRTTDFGFRLFHQVLAGEPGKNVFISPTSIAMALSMTYNGADGDTRAGMAKALSISGLSLEQVNKANLALLLNLTAPDEGVKLKIANSLWVRKGYRLAPAFIKRDEKYYRARVTALALGPGAVKIINSWVKDNTDGMIGEIVKQLKPLDMLVLVNAVCFKGVWAEKFDKALTKPGPFTLAAGDKITLQMMRRHGKYAYFATSDFQAISLPYAGGRMSMYIFLPDSASGLRNFCRRLTPQTWDAWLAKLDEEELDIVMPRFKVEYEAVDKLKDALTGLGMGCAFGMGADFRSMVASHAPELFISRVAHKAFMEVDEQGTKAAAATSVTMTLKAMPGQPLEMLVDHPFFCAIRDNKTRAILFMGAIERPT